MSTIPSYPAPNRALDGFEQIAGWQDGRQVSISASSVAGLAQGQVAQLLEDVRSHTASDASTALQAKVDAQAARDIVLTQNGFYPTTAAGVASTPVGCVFATNEGGVFAWYERVTGTPGYAIVGHITNSYVQVQKAANSNNLSIVIGNPSLDPSQIGQGCVVIGGWVEGQFTHRLPGTTNLRYIFGGYDCEIGGTGTIASGIVCSHHSKIYDGADHGIIVGSGYCEILAGTNVTIIGGGSHKSSASFSIVAGGNANTIGGGADYSAIIGGTQHNITGAIRAAIVGGYGNIIGVGAHNSFVAAGTGINMKAGGSVAGGGGHDIEGASLFVFGLNNVAKANYGGVWGYLNSKLVDHATVFGQQAVGRSFGLTTAGGCIATAGDAQTSRIDFKGQTTGANAVFATTCNNDNLLVRLPLNNVGAGLVANIVAIEVGAGASKYFRLEGLMKRVSNTTSGVGSPTVTVLAADDGTAAWNVGIYFFANFCLVMVSGESGKTINWSGDIKANEVSY